MDDNTQHVMFSSAATEYGTPPEIFEPIQDAMQLNFDAAASHENHRLPHYATKDGEFMKHFTTPSVVRGVKDGLDARWEGQRTWCNPPYGKGIEDWVKRAAQAVYTGNLHPDEVDYTSVAMLLPARTETSWFQRWVAPYAVVHFIMGRVRFWGHTEGCFWVMDWHDGPDGTLVKIPRRLEVPDHPIHQLPAAPFPSIIAEYSPRIVVAQGRVSGRTWDPRSGPFVPAVPL